MTVDGPAVLQGQTGSQTLRRHDQTSRACAPFAVLAVFADHLFDWPSGGFVGVDVFFVLSGFFITGLLIRERTTTRKLSFQHFYVRRVKRILPSAVLVLIVTVVGSYLLFPAIRAKETLVDALYAAVFAANFRFEAVGTDYFQEGQPPSPLQHYWSLSIEEQFYFVWPVVLGRVSQGGVRSIEHHAPGAKQIGEVVPSVAVIGTRGYPSYYSGFETAVRKLAPYLASTGWDVTVYGRRGATRLDDPDMDARVVTRVTRGLETKSASTLSYGFTSALDAAARRPDVALVMNVANGYYLPLLRARGVPTLVNVDGLEWERAKWGTLAKRVFRTGAECTARWASGLVFDARAIETYWQDTFGVRGTFIPYGGDVPPALAVPEGLAHRGYVLMVARFVPENSVPEFFEAVPAIAAQSSGGDSRELWVRRRVG